MRHSAEHLGYRSLTLQGIDHFAIAPFELCAFTNTLARIQRWREICPDITLRSTFIVGFPGETEQDFQLLLDWLAEARLDRVGCFRYSPVEGAAANALPDHVPEDVKQERYERFMELATTISSERLAAKVGRMMRVLVDTIDADGAVARSSADAPEIDGTVRIARPGKLAAGDWADVRITGSSAYDLTGTLARRSAAIPATP